MTPERTRDVPGSSRTPRPWGTVYFLRRRDEAVKIGYTSNLRQRMATLEKEHGPLEVVGTIPGDTPVEHRCHDIFASHRLFGGEWFRWRDDMQRVIDQGHTDGWETYSCQSCMVRFGAWESRDLCDPYCRVRQFFKRRALVLSLIDVRDDVPISDIRWGLRL